MAQTKRHGSRDARRCWRLGPGIAETVAGRIKYDVCAEFIICKRENNLNQRELAQKLEISEALFSKILR